MRLSKEKIDLNIEINKKVKVDEQTFFTSYVSVSHALHHSHMPFFRTHCMKTGTQNP